MNKFAIILKIYEIWLTLEEGNGLCRNATRQCQDRGLGEYTQRQKKQLKRLLLSLQQY